MPGARPRSSDHTTDPLPDPVQPATRVCAPPETARHHGSPSSVTPTGTASRSTASGTGSGLTTSTSRSWRPSVRSRYPGRPGAGVTRHDRAPKACARASERRSQSSGCWPTTIRTRTRSAYRPARTRTTRGSHSSPSRRPPRPAKIIEARHRKPVGPRRPPHAPQHPAGRRVEARRVQPGPHAQPDHGRHDHRRRPRPGPRRPRHRRRAPGRRAAPAAGPATSAQRAQAGRLRRATLPAARPGAQPSDSSVGGAHRNPSSSTRPARRSHSSR